MRTSLTFGWPIEEQTDARRDFPTRVDGPRTDAIDAQLARSGIRAFATAAARDTAVPAPVEGQAVWLQDLDQLQVWIGTVWAPVGGKIPAARTRRVAANISVPAGNSRHSYVPIEQSLTGGIALSTSDGTVTVPAAGMYHIHGLGVFMAMPAGSSGALNVGTVSAAYGWGTSGLRDAAGYGTSAFSTNVGLTAGAKISLWTSATAAMQIETTELHIEWIGAD